MLGFVVFFIRRGDIYILLRSDQCWGKHFNSVLASADARIRLYQSEPEIGRLDRSLAFNAQSTAVTQNVIKKLKLKIKVTIRVH